MSDLAAWLLEQITEDERVALSGVKFESWNRSWDTEPLRDIAVGGQRVGTVSTDYDEHICRWNPARVLAECAAKRGMVAEHADYSGDCWICNLGGSDYVWDGEFEHVEYVSRPVIFPCRTLRLLALPYADRLGYLAEWAP